MTKTAPKYTVRIEQNADNAFDQPREFESIDDLINWAWHVKSSQPKLSKSKTPEFFTTNIDPGDM